MVRGGAFNNNHKNARCANRNRNNPNNHNRNNGFRVVVCATLFCKPEMPDGRQRLPGRGEERRGLFPAELGEIQAGRITTAACPGCVPGRRQYPDEVETSQREDAPTGRLYGLFDV
jgi:hypothetical protein